MKTRLWEVTPAVLFQEWTPWTALKWSGIYAAIASWSPATQRPCSSTWLPQIPPRPRTRRAPHPPTTSSWTAARLRGATAPSRARAASSSAASPAARARPGAGGGRSPAPAPLPSSPAGGGFHGPTSPPTHPGSLCAACTAPIWPWPCGGAAAAASQTPAAPMSSAAAPTPASWRSATVPRPTGTLASSRFSSPIGPKATRTGGKRGDITYAEGRLVWRRLCEWHKLYPPLIHPSDASTCPVTDKRHDSGRRYPGNHAQLRHWLVPINIVVAARKRPPVCRHELQHGRFINTGQGYPGTCETHARQLHDNNQNIWLDGLKPKTEK